MFSTVELHFSNKCTGNCVICSKAHGGNNLHFVSEEVIRAVAKNIREIGCDVDFQLGGDGDSFLHPQFLDFLCLLRDEAPNGRRSLYSNFFMFTPEMSDRIERGGLLHEAHTRIDSLDPNIFQLSTGLPMDRVLANVEYFAKINTHARFDIAYFPLYQYRQLVRAALHKEPTYIERLGNMELSNEWMNVHAYCTHMKSKRPVIPRLSGLSLWAERTDCEFSDYPCPRLPENKPGTMKKQIYIYPNGNYGGCGYDDGQDTFIMGNILTHRLEDVWNGPKWLEFMDIVRNRTKDDHPACCVNPKACVMWEPGEFPKC